MTLGVGIPHQNGDPAGVLAKLKPRFWYDWKWSHIGKAFYYPMAWECKDTPYFAQAIAAAKANPPQTWLVGNEPENADQSNTTPDEFAEAAWEWVKETPGKWAGPGVIWDNGGRDWLERYKGPKPDIVTLHFYGARNITEWQSMLRHAKEWLKVRGWSPYLWITETNLAAGNDQRPLLKYLAHTPDLLGVWYCARDPFGAWRYADLIGPRGGLTTLGLYFVSVTANSSSGGGVTYLPMVNA